MLPYLSSGTSSGMSSGMSPGTSSALWSGILFAVLLAAAPCATTVTAQTSDEALKELTQAFSTADAGRLAGISTSTLDLALLGSARSYSRRQATLMMRSFFREYPPESFRIADFTKTGRGWFIEAVYVTKDRLVPFRVYIRLRLDERGWLVRDLTIEENRE